MLGCHPEFLLDPPRPHWPISLQGRVTIESPTAATSNRLFWKSVDNQDKTANFKYNLTRIKTPMEDVMARAIRVGRHSTSNPVEYHSRGRRPCGLSSYLCNSSVRVHPVPVTGGEKDRSQLRRGGNWDSHVSISRVWSVKLISFPTSPQKAGEGWDTGI
jgi:hypothetical protein